MKLAIKKQALMKFERILFRSREGFIARLGENLRLHFDFTGARITRIQGGYCCDIKEIPAFTSNRLDSGHGFGPDAGHLFRKPQHR